VALGYALHGIKLCHKQQAVDNLNTDLLSGNIGVKFCIDLRTVRCQISHVRRNFRRKLLGGRCVFVRAAGLSCAELGPSSAHRQSFRSTDFTAVLVIQMYFFNSLYCTDVIDFDDQNQIMFILLTSNDSESKKLAPKSVAQNRAIDVE